MAKRSDEDKPGLPEAASIFIDVIAEAAADAVRRVAAEIRSSSSIEAFFGAERQSGKPGGSTSEAEGGASSGSGGRAPRGGSNNRSNTLNPNNPAHSAAADNRSNQMNPNNSAYWSSRGR